MLRLAITFLLISTLPSFAVSRASHCIALAESDATPVHRATLGGLDPIEKNQVRIHYAGHAKFVIETDKGLTIATDYDGFVGIGVTPDVITMNIAHDSHHTFAPTPGVTHVLRGWGPDRETPAKHALELDDEILIRNVTTDIRSGFGERYNDGNSIFVFEMAGLCIGHLGHLHHEPNEEQYAKLGRLDVVMAPVDGGYTMALEDMIRVLKRLRSSMIIPMHWWGDGTLERFLNGMRSEFAVEMRDAANLTVSIKELPRTPTVVVLRPQYLRGDK